MASRYRALLIGNSTYPADEHNLQTLKGPVKDIAALNRALTDPDTGLFADVDVTLLPEVTSARAIRALGRFFGTAARDDVLMLYFSGHGKLDQGGRLHLCMQDTESADLLSTAVSSARIREFADASYARNVIIVLDCCYAGAFRGGELGDAVAGPGRYVLTSCRGTQLANDATVENGTSYFTQHLVDGLLRAAGDQDGDGYVTFSDLYAYVDRQLREAGKQIPQRRVEGDGDVHLARRPQPAPARTTAAAPPAGRTVAVAPPGQPKGEPADVAAASAKSVPVEAGSGAGSAGSASTGAPGAAGAAPAAGRSRSGKARRNILIAAAAALVVAGGVSAALALTLGGSGSAENSQASGSLYTGKPFAATAPWRLKIEDQGYGNGCNLWYIDTHSGNRIQLAEGLYDKSVFEISATGTFRWQVNDPRCVVVALSGPETTSLPFAIDQSGTGDTAAFTAPSTATVQALVKNWHSSGSCYFELYDLASGDRLDFATATKGQNPAVTLNTEGRKQVYLKLFGCGVRVSAG